MKLNGNMNLREFIDSLDAGYGIDNATSPKYIATMLNSLFGRGMDHMELTVECISWRKKYSGYPNYGKSHIMWMIDAPKIFSEQVTAAFNDPTKRSELGASLPPANHAIESKLKDNGKLILHTIS